MQEFIKHDLSKFKNTNFNIQNYLNEIEGFIRFECEIKKRKLKSFFNSDFIRIVNISYSELKEIWREEFSKFFKILENDLNIVSSKDLIRHRLNSQYTTVRARNLYNFYLLILVQGLQTVKNDFNRSMYYKNISDLKKAGIDFSQKLNLDMTDTRIDFNPFKSDEIL